jgi:maltose alpha-D-glucosyltransferase/alpha-amylase
MRNWFEAKYPEGVLIAEWSNPKQSVDAGFMIDFMMHFNVPGYPSMFFNSEGVFPRDTCYFDARGIGNPFEFIHHYMDQVKGVGNRGYVSIPTANHDINRPHAGSRNTPEQLKVLMTFLLTLKGIPFIYYGDEIGMRYVPALPDKEGSVLEIPGTQNRAGSRTPMQWDNTKNAGFSEADSIYLPIDSKHFYPNVQGQEKNPGSLLNYTRHLINLRKLYPALGNTGQIQFLNKDSETYPLVYERSLESQRLIIVINPSARDAEFVIKGYDGFEFEEIITDKARIMSDTKDSIIYVGTFGYGIFLIK